MNISKRKLMPFLLTGLIILADQISKAIIVRAIPENHIGASILNNFLRIIHARNLGVAFSMGGQFPDAVRSILFTVLPIIILVLIIVYYFKSEELIPIQRWALAGILGGGIGNLLDRIFRPQGVVDFIDIRFYGIFGLERWPTFNIADASVVITGILLLVSFLFMKQEQDDEQKP